MTRGGRDAPANFLAVYSVMVPNRIGNIAEKHPYSQLLKSRNLCMDTPIPRRDALKTLGLGAAVLTFGPLLARAQTPSPPNPAASAGATPAGPFKLPPLTYAFNALEPSIDARTMEIHHDKHHAAYVAALNKLAETNPELGKKSPDEIIRDLNAQPEAIRAAVRNNGGGHVNHTMFWTQLKGGGGGEPSAKLADALKSSFGEVAKFKEAMNDAGAKRFGSGWAWLVANNRKLEVVSTANQDNPMMGKAIAGAEGIPLLGVDVWEHAYYLLYQNRRADYLKAWWNVVNWADVNARFDKAMA